MKFFSVGMLALPLGAMAELSPHVDASVGERRVVVSLGDSLRTPDLSFLRLDGYGIEHAVFLEESDDFKLSKDFWDLTLPSGPRIVQRVKSDSGIVVLEVPPGQVPVPGIVLADTAMGGFLAKIVEVREIIGSQTVPLFWVRTQPAFLNDAIQDGTIKFTMRLDMNALMSDFSGRVDVVNPENRNGEMDISLKSGKVLFQPGITGMLGVRNGLMETLRIRVQGLLEISGAFSATLRNPGHFTHVEALPVFREFRIPIGHGLVLTVQETFDLRVEAQADNEEIIGHAQLRLRQNPSADLVFNSNRWQSLGEAMDVSGEQPILSIQGAGSLRFAVEPRLEFLICGQPGPGLTFTPSVRMVGWGGASIRGDSSMPGMGAWLGNGLLFHAPPLSILGSSLRSYPLFNRETPWMSPPREGLVQIRGGDSVSVLLNCQTMPKADYYVVQNLLPSGIWNNVLFGAPGPTLRVGDLLPGTNYHFRVVGVNAQGTGPAFPPEGILYSAPFFSASPEGGTEAALSSGDSAFIQGDSIRLSWRSVPGNGKTNGVFNVYFGNSPETLVPIAQSLQDSQTVLSHLDSGQYFWKVEYVQGQSVRQGLLHPFVFNSPPKKTAPPPLAREQNGMPLIPAGTFRRGDGKNVFVGAFYLQRFEVTQEEYRRLIGTNPSFHSGDSLPVERVSWEEAAAYCRESGSRLPTEGEWEYAARAGENSEYFWGRKSPIEYARFRDNSENRTWPVGSLKPNEFGLYDMAGNVFEWVQDWYAPYKSELQNPQGAPTGTSRVIRGASWYSEAKSLNLSARFFNRPGFRNYKVGFRCAQDVRNPETASVSP